MYNQLVTQFYHTYIVQVKSRRDSGSSVIVLSVISVQETYTFIHKHSKIISGAQLLQLIFMFLEAICNVSSICPASHCCSI